MGLNSLREKTLGRLARRRGVRSTTFDGGSKGYGIVWNKALDAGGFILGDEVEVEISLQLQKQKPEAAN